MTRTPNSSRFLSGAWSRHDSVAPLDGKRPRAEPISPLAALRISTDEQNRTDREKRAEPEKGVPPGTGGPATPTRNRSSEPRFLRVCHCLWLYESTPRPAKATDGQTPSRVRHQLPAAVSPADDSIIKKRTFSGMYITWRTPHGVVSLSLNHAAIYAITA